MTYFHPRDFDADQPMIPNLSLPRKFKSYYGITNSLKKLDFLLNSYLLFEINNFAGLDVARIYISNHTYA